MQAVNAKLHWIFGIKFREGSHGSISDMLFLGVVKFMVVVVVVSTKKKPRRQN